MISDPPLVLVCGISYFLSTSTVMLIKYGYVYKMPGLETKGPYKRCHIKEICHDNHGNVCVRIPSIHNQQPTISHSFLVASNLFSKSEAAASDLSNCGFFFTLLFFNFTIFCRDSLMKCPFLRTKRFIIISYSAPVFLWVS
jgi:hypothetical protein